jgi:hypothetical protein
VQELNAELAMEVAFREGIAAGTARVGEWELKRHRYGYAVAAPVLETA